MAHLKYVVITLIGLAVIFMILTGCSSVQEVSATTDNESVMVHVRSSLPVDTTGMSIGRVCGSC